MKRRKFMLASVYDTETTNYIDEESKKNHRFENTRAFPILFIDNDIRDIDLRTYEPDKCDKINFYRHEWEMQARIDEYIKWGRVAKLVPIICAYNLMFDLHPLMEELNARYDIKANAQSSTNVYTVDLFERDTDTLLLRFWDTFHLEMRGLSAMGKTCGIEKAVGDWDYSLQRTPDTELSEMELFYAARDVQVIPAYLRYLLKANEWMKQEDLGCRVLTKTSIVRQMAKRTIGPKVIREKNGKKLDLRKSMMEICKQELPKSYAQYAIRKASFRGGFTFTSASTSLMVLRNVVSVDVTSMHHTFINGRRIPVHFQPCKPDTLQRMLEDICSKSPKDILERYHQPFDFAFHGRVRIKNVRLKSKSAFQRFGIGLLAQSKFSKTALRGDYENSGEAATMGTQETLDNGFHDSASSDAVFAFGKLYEASEIVIHVSELEMWCVSRVYEWDEIRAIGGDATAQWTTPPDYVTAQSNILYKQKDLAKFIANHYVEGEPYPYNLESIPDGIAESLRNGTCEWSFFNSWYTGTVKGMFNGIYGTMAQDQFKPSYKCVDGELLVDEETITTKENFKGKIPKNSMVLYTYGLRIVGGSRMHMIISIEMIHDYFGNRVDVLGGDTDSMKMRCDVDVIDDEIEMCLQPIAEASKNSINNVMKRLRKYFPEFSSPLTGIGAFEVENRGRHYDYHIEGWNKCRLSYDTKAHITCAGLSRPSGKFNIENFVDSMVKKYPIEKVLEKIIGFNVFVCAGLSYSLEAHHPKVRDRYVGDVCDYKGKTSHVEVHESTALYSVGRWLGETLKVSNAQTCAFLKKRYQREIDTSCKYLDFMNGNATIEVDSIEGVSKIMEVSIWRDS